MSRFREIKRQMRGDVHREASVPALYIPTPSAIPVKVTVRVHRRPDVPTFDMTGYPGAAEMFVAEDRIRFLRSELPNFLRTGGTVSVEAGEAYKIEFWYPRDDQFITARVTPLTEGDAKALPVPNG